MQVLLFSTLFGIVFADFGFISVGDWGGADLDRAQYGDNVAAVAAQMARTTSAIDSQFIIGTGDNFYWCGIMNSSDYQIEGDWVKPYSKTTPKLTDQNWYQVLGNHEYGYNVKANFLLNQKYPTWIQPTFYYTERMRLSSTESLSMIFLDTSPCVSEYRSSNNAGWDPCGAEYPTCSIKNPADPHDPFEGKCMFHENILTQDCSKQLTWFKSALSKVPKDDWLIVVGHHPLDEMDVEDFVTPLHAHGFDLYLNGHAHTMTYYSINGVGKYVTTGAGSMVDLPTELPLTPGKERTYNKTEGLPLRQYKGKSYTSIFNQKVAGFTSHTFSSDFKTLETNFVDYTGKVVYKFSVEKGVNPPPPPPPAPPAPGPNVCCHYDDVACSSGNVCCKTDCNDPTTCSYTETGCKEKYGQKHNCGWNQNKCLVAHKTDI